MFLSKNKIYNNLINTGKIAWNQTNDNFEKQKSINIFFLVINDHKAI